jgi:hypothetical protein
VGAQTLFSKQYDFGYSQGGRWRFGRGGRDNLNRSNGRSNKGNTNLVINWFNWQ